MRATAARACDQRCRFASLGPGIDQGIGAQRGDRAIGREECFAIPVEVPHRQVRGQLVGTGVRDSHVMAAIQRIAARGGADRTGAADEYDPH